MKQNNKRMITMGLMIVYFMVSSHFSNGIDSLDIMYVTGAVVGILLWEFYGMIFNVNRKELCNEISREN